MEELYDRTPWMLCSFGESDEACTCMRCSTEKWPEGYSSWILSGQQISEAKSIEPEKRKEWVRNHVMGERLFAESENVNDGIRYDGGGGGLAVQGNENGTCRDNTSARRSQLNRKQERSG